MRTLGAIPTVTFVVPCYNHGRFVGEAVASALAQEGAEARAVVVDDGSDDGSTAGACDALLVRHGPDRVTVIHQDNAGLPAARNRGALGATSDYLVFLDADDTVAPDFAMKLAAAVEGAADGRVSHAYCQETLTERAHGTWRVPGWDPELLLITNLHPVTCLVRRDVFEEAGGFDRTMTEGYEDWEFWIRLSERGYRGVRVAEPLFFWRRHSPDTMVHEAVRKHDKLYAQIIQRHRWLYERSFEGLARRCNSMLRAFDCNWIDETGRPIPLQYLERKTAEAHGLERRLAGAASERAELAERLALLERRLDEQRREYESMGLVRLHHRVHRALGSMPGVARRPILGALRWLKRMVVGRSA